MENDDEIRDLLRKMYALQQEQFAEYRRAASYSVANMRLWRRLLIVLGILSIGGGVLIGTGIYGMSQRIVGRERARMPNNQALP